MHDVTPLSSTLNTGKHLFKSDRSDDIGRLLRQAASALLKQFTGTQYSRLWVCQELLSGNAALLEDEGLRFEFENSKLAERHYLIGALYMLLMPPSRRQRLAAYFTPPHLCDYIIGRMVEFGLDVEQHTVLDPACGGSAFLVPLAQRIAEHGRARGLQPSQIIDNVAGGVRGIEIEPNLARLSQMMIANVLKDELSRESRQLAPLITRQNSLKVFAHQEFDAVISNPPYGRVFKPSPLLVGRWSRLISDGHVNTYSLFMGVALGNVKRGGLVGLVIPTSFTAGPYFAALRQFLREEADILQIDLIEKRNEVFIDVVQDTCVLFLRRKGDVESLSTPAKCHSILSSGEMIDLGFIQMDPLELKSVWVLPPRSTTSSGKLRAEPKFFDARLSNLEDYGYTVKSGYFVWNRSGERLATRMSPKGGELPLIWAHNIKAGLPIKLSPGPAKTGHRDGEISCVSVNSASSAICTSRSIVIQRTTNRNQSKRLVAGIVSQDLIDRYGAYVTENHTILISPVSGQKPKVPLEFVLDLLNTSTVDIRYRQISGTVSVSTKLLRILPLPAPEMLIDAFRYNADREEAARLAYSQTLSPTL